MKAVAELLGQPRESPFAILCGTSAGAINAAALAIHADDFAESVRHLVGVWEGFRCHHVYRSDWPGIIRTGRRWLGNLMLINRTNSISLLDNALPRELPRLMDFGRIQGNIDSGAVYAVSVTASGHPGVSVTFYQGGSGLEDWERWQRVGASTTLKRRSAARLPSAIPFIFPAVKFITASSSATARCADRADLAGAPPRPRQGARDRHWAAVARAGAGAVEPVPFARADRRPRAQLDLPRQPRRRHRAPAADQQDAATRRAGQGEGARPLVAPDRRVRAPTRARDRADRALRPAFPRRSGSCCARSGR